MDITIYDIMILVITFDHCAGTAVGSGLALDLELCSMFIVTSHLLAR